MLSPQKLNQFVHLHLHTCYSLLDGACRIDELLDDAVKMGMPAMALTDHGVLYGAIEFYEKAKKRGINPIIGCEIYVAPRSRHGRTPKLDDNPHHLVVLAQNEEGYRNLLHLVSIASLEGFYYRPRVDKELLNQHSKGLIALSACLAGEVPENILKQDLQKAKEAALSYQDIFGKENYFLEVQDHDLKLQHEVNRGLVEIAKDLKIPFVATNDVHYTKRTHAGAHDVLLCIQTGKKVEDQNRLRFETEEFYLKSYAEVEPRFQEFPDSIQNTLNIAERCNLKIPLGEQFLLPQYPIPEGFSAETYLRKLCQDGMPYRYPSPGPEVTARLETELSVINSMGFADYFLIVWDFIRYAKERKIPVGPGRGSVAGSIVAFLLGITEIDPLKYNLLFERFLNIGRKKMPDIDTDFCDLHRDEMIRYVVDKYGKERVAQIVTFGTMRARAAVRDAGRVLSLPIPEVDRVAKFIPPKATVSEAKDLTEIQALIAEKPFIKELIETAEKIEGLPRNASIHAAGVVIAKDSLLDHVAVQKMQGEAVVCQYEMGALEKIGLLKMDFLGLRTLSLIADALKIIEGTRGIEIVLDNIPLDDKKTFKLLSDANTVGVFQLESSLAQQILRDYKPDCFTDVIATVALNRPGPLQSGMVGEFIKSRHGKIKIKFPHPLLEPILKETYGIFLYQEQVMQTAVAMGGFSMTEADSLREAMGKKKVDLMAKYKEKFLAGAKERKIEDKVAQSIWDTMDKFALYGFNKSHSAGYGLVSYWTAYLKANFPVEFMAATLTSLGDKTDKVSIMVSECRRMGIEVLPPDVNESDVHFTTVAEPSHSSINGGTEADNLSSNELTRKSIPTVVEGRIRFGLGAIKNVGEKAIEGLIEERNKSGRFKSIHDFCSRLDLRAVNRKVLESLIKSGALDSLGWSRAKSLANLDDAMEYAAVAQREKASGQTSFFGAATGATLPIPTAIHVDEFPKEKLLIMEREMLGLYISDHPMNEHLELLGRLSVVPIARLVEHGDKVATAAGIVSQVKRITTKNNLPMAFATLEDPSGQVEAVIFSKVYDACNPVLIDDALVVVKGKVTVKEDEGAGEDDEPTFQSKILAEEVTPLSQFLAKSGKVTLDQGIVTQPEGKREGSFACHISVDLSAVSGNLLPRIKSLLQEERGHVPVFLRIKSEKGISDLVLSADFFVKDVGSISEKFSANFGSAVEVREKRIEGSESWSSVGETV